MNLSVRDTSRMSKVTPEKLSCRAMYIPRNCKRVLHMHYSNMLHGTGMANIIIANTRSMIMLWAYLHVHCNYLHRSNSPKETQVFQAETYLAGGNITVFGQYSIANGGRKCLRPGRKKQNLLLLKLVCQTHPRFTREKFHNKKPSSKYFHNSKSLVKQS